MSSATSSTELYSTAVGELWSGITPILRRLDGLAADPDATDEDTLLPALRRLQYSLHLAVERAYGFAPPPGSQPAHAELAAALAAARDATAEVSAAVDEHGAAGLRPMLYEWRGAIFRVRLARMQLAAAVQAPPRGPSRHTAPTGDAAGVARPLAAVALVMMGTGLFVAGAVDDIWRLWAAGIVAVGLSFAVHRP